MGYICRCFFVCLFLVLISGRFLGSGQPVFGELSNAYVGLDEGRVINVGVCLVC